MTQERATSDGRRVLIRVLGLNLLLVAGLGTAGILGDSSGLVANALDNASDSAVYVISLLAIARGAEWKVRAARASGILLMVFAVGVLFDAYRRYVGDAEPLGGLMMALGVVSAAVNLECLRELRKLSGPSVNIRAASTFSANDAVANLGILIAGALVAWTGDAWPDLAVGVAIALVALWGGIEIMRDAGAEASA